MKKWTMHHLPEHGALAVQCRGRFNESDAKEMVAATVAEANRLGVLRMLVDNREMIPEGTPEEYFHFQKTIGDLGFTPMHRVAVVFPPGRPGYEDMRFMETAAFNRHLGIRLFPGFEEALTWLEQ